LKFVALRLPEIIWGTRKIWEVLGYAHTPFSPKFFMGLCSDDYPVNIPTKFEVLIVLAVPEIIVIAFLGWGCIPPGEGKAVWVGDGTIRKSICEYTR